MADVSMCAREQCPRKLECYRYRAVPGVWQSYFAPDPKTCRDFWPIEPGMRLANREKLGEAECG